MKNTFKKIAALVLAIACVMSITISASAANTTVPDGTAVCADIYIPMRVHNLIKFDAHLSDDAVPPKHAPTANNTTVNMVNGKMQITFTMVNDTFVIEKDQHNLDLFATVGGYKAVGNGARIVDVTWTNDSYRDNTERAATITFEFDSLNTEYVFSNIHEYANPHRFVSGLGADGPKNFDLRFKVVQR